MSLKTLSAFEHGTLRVASGELSQAQFDVLARFNDAHGQRYFRLGHRRLTFRSFVGYLQVGKLGIEILPKLDRDARGPNDTAIWHNFLLEMLRVSFGLTIHSPTPAARQIGRPTLLELVAQRFVGEVERLLHEGLSKGYREVEANGATFRGRLLGSAHVRANCARADRFYVRYSAFDRDVPINRILGAALEVLSHHALSAAVRARVCAAAALFPEVSTNGVDARDCQLVVLARSTVRYRDALLFARMILENRAPELRGGDSDVFAVLFDMNALWERYVGWLFRRAAPANCDVVLQESRGFWRARPAPVRRVRPDFVLRDRASGRVLLIADAKWKALEEAQPIDEHLKQMFVYNHLFGCGQALLVYPSAGAGRCRLEGAYLDREHRCGTVELGLLEGEGLRGVGMIEQLRRQVFPNFSGSGSL